MYTDARRGHLARRPSRRAPRAARRVGGAFFAAEPPVMGGEWREDSDARGAAGRARRVPGPSVRPPSPGGSEGSARTAGRVRAAGELPRRSRPRRVPRRALRGRPPRPPRLGGGYSSNSSKPLNKSTKECVLCNSESRFLW